MIRVFLSDGCWYLVVPAATGVVYFPQAGGIACTHPEVEGFVYEAFPGKRYGEWDGFRLEEVACRVGCWENSGSWTPENVALVNGAMYEDIGEGWELDPDRLSESYEGWLWVRRGEGRAYPDDTFYPDRGVLCGRNCD